MAIGLTMIVQERFPSLAGPILPVSLGAVVVFEVLGPLLTRMAILRAGESPEPQRASRWLDAILPNPRPAP